MVTVVVTRGVMTRAPERGLRSIPHTELDRPTFDDDESVFEAVRAGALGYLLETRVGPPSSRR